MISIKNTVHIKQQNNQSIMSSMMVLDENNIITNKKIINQIVYHKGKQSKQTYINNCANIKKNFNAGNTDILCAQQKQIRNS